MFNQILGITFLLSLTVSFSKAQDIAIANKKAIVENSISYQNPIKIEPLRDPQILFVGGIYYMPGTSQLDGSITKAGAGVKLFSSKNLTEWKFEKVLIKPDGCTKLGFGHQKFIKSITGFTLH